MVKKDSPMSSALTTPLNDPAAWYSRDLMENDDWIHNLTKTEIKELTDAVTASQRKSLLSIGRSDFPLPTLAVRLNTIAKEVDQGLGLALIRGIPVERMSADEAARALWGLGQHIGIPQIQDAAQALLHDVRDVGGAWQDESSRRVYETNAAQPFHNDGGDLVMLLCRRAAQSGGTSRMVSAVTLFNEVLRRSPPLADVLQSPFPFDARGQQLPGQPPVQHVPIFVWYADRLNALHKRHYIEEAQRFENVKRLSESQVQALDLVDEICEDPAIHIAFDMIPGDIQIACNFNILHARDRFVDHIETNKKRHMLRLWLGLPDGRPLAEVYRGTREFGPLFEVRGRGHLYD